MVAQRLFPVGACLLIVFALACASPLKDDDDSSSPGLVKNIGNQVVDKFDKVFYGLLDEAAQKVTDDEKGAFKDMVIRHRGDLLHNVKENLVNNDNIKLSDVQRVIEQELNNRLELFKYVGNGATNIWRKATNWYRNHCENEKSFFCWNTSKRSAKTTPEESYDQEREFSP